MSDKIPASLDIDQLVDYLTMEEFADAYGIPRDKLQRSGKEIRIPCTLAGCENCDQTGDRVIAILADHRAKLWKCHHYVDGEACNKQGNFVSLVSLALGGPIRPRGEDFKRVSRALRSMANGEGPIALATSTDISAPDSPPPAQTKAKSQPAKPRSNVKPNTPLEESENEKIRAIADLYRKLTMDITKMPPYASRYVRMRPFLTEDLAAQRKFGYLSRGTGGDRSGGTQRGKFVYSMANPEGKINTYFGRDTDWEAKHVKWIAGGRVGKEPSKFHFVSGYQRGLDLYGQEFMKPEIVGDSLQEIGLPVVEGPNDVLNLIQTLRIHAVGLCSNNATKSQIERIAELAHEVAGGTITLLLDCDQAGDKGADLFSSEASKHARVQRAWARDMHSGKFDGRQPESLTMAEGRELREFLVGRK